MLRQKLKVHSVPIAVPQQLVGSFLSDGVIRGMTSTSMEFDIAISFLFVNSFKLSYKRYRYEYLCILSRMVLELHARPRSKVKFIKHVELKINFVLGFSQKYLNLF